MRVEVTIDKTKPLPVGALDALSGELSKRINKQFTDRRYELVAAANTVILPMGVYSKRVKSLGELKDGAIIGVPKELTNSFLTAKIKFRSVMREQIACPYWAELKLIAI